MSISIQRTDFQQRYREQVERMRQRASERLASGRRIARAADDSAGLAISKRLEAAVRGNAQGERNVADGRSLVRTAEASLQGSQDALARMRELTIQAQNGTLSASDREVIQQEYDQLSAQLDQTARGTDFGGRALLDGSAGGVDAIRIDDGNGGQTAIDIDDAGAAALGVQGLDVGDAGTVAALDAARDRLSGQRARLGALDGGFSRQEQQLAVARANAEEARSRIEDVDVAREVANRTRARILSDLTLAGQRIADGSRQRVLDLLA
ncbi:MAG: flagellin FliC [Planctomycetes bacterium]|nr:flagellin FliC [Planctomycetota bacterium]